MVKINNNQYNWHFLQFIITVFWFTVWYLVNTFIETSNK